MSLSPHSTIREVHDITHEEKQRIIDFLQGAVYCWCKNRPDEWFSMRDLMGGENFNWEGTPLFVLFNKYLAKKKNDSEAIEAAGKDSGWILKKIIHNDYRVFETKKEDLIRKYRWVRFHQK